MSMPPLPGDAPASDPLAWIGKGNVEEKKVVPYSISDVSWTRRGKQKRALRGLQLRFLDGLALPCLIVCQTSGSFIQDSL